jgi:hypothetical protein
MEKKVKAGKMSEEEEKKVTQWFLEARSDRSLSKSSMEERYPLVYAMTDSNQKEPQQDEQPKEDKTIAATDSSAAIQPTTVTVPTSMETTQQVCDEEKIGEKTMVKVAAEPSDPKPSSESSDVPMTEAEPVSLPDANDGKLPPVHRVSSKQRRLSFEEYRSVYLPVPKIENRMPIFISASLRDELDKIARRLGGKRMSASGIVENMVKHHLITYGDELKEWYKL